MRIQFRQGVVDAPNNFLQLTGSTVSLNVAQPNYVSVTLADGVANYLHTERASINNAWTGPFVPGTTDYWLYWDIDRQTGIRTFGHTTVEPIYAATAPLSPIADQHWFDTSNYVMKVWNAPANRWIQKIRVFAGLLENGTILVGLGAGGSSFEGTQLGAISPQPVTAGALVFDIFGQPVKRNNGAFFTTEDVAVASVASSTQVKLASMLIEAVAITNIPAYSVVQFVDFSQINLATTALVETGAYGIIEQDANTGEVVNVALQGIVSNPEWDWTAAGVNAPLYVTNLGQLTTTPTVSEVVIGYVIDKNTIILRPTIQTVNTVVTDPAIFTYSTSQNMLASHKNAIVRMNSATGVNYTVRTNASVPMSVGATIVISQHGIGPVTIVPENGSVTIVSPETLTTRKQYAKVTLTQTSANYWEVEGNLEAAGNLPLQ